MVAQRVVRRRRRRTSVIRHIILVVLSATALWAVILAVGYLVYLLAR